MSALISIIVPVYNVEKYLCRCVDSILAQSYPHLEIILVDDGSTDSSGNICDAYREKDERIVVIHKPNGGLSSARNAGLEIAKGEYIGFVDSDDYVSKDMYASLLERLENSETDIANIMYARAYESGETAPSPVPHKQNEDFSAEAFLEELLLHVGDVSACTKLFPKALIGDLRFKEGVLNEDLLFMTDLIPRLKTVRFVGKVGYFYFVRTNSISASYGKAFIDMQKNALTVLDFVKANYPHFKKQAYRFALYQNMAYLLSIPEGEATQENTTYRSALRFVRKYTLKNLFNRYLKAKEKLILCALLGFPKGLAKIFQKKHR